MDQEGRRQQPLTLRREGHLDRIVHAARQDVLDRPSFDPSAEDVRRPGHERFPPGALIGLFRKRPLRPVDPAVETEVRPVQVIGAIGQGLGIKPFHPLVRDAVAVGVGELPDAWRCGHVNRAIVPEHAFGEHHFVGEDGARVVAAIAIRIFQAKDAVGALRELLLDRVIRSRGLGHVQPAVVVHVHDHRPLD